VNLPDFLEELEFGEVRVRGHRIGLFHIIEDYNAGCSPEAIHADFPTLSPELIDQVLAFYGNNRAEVDAYVTRCREESDRLRQQTRPIDWEELRRRMQARNHSGNGD
jgi:uncharacterized protein (DUF433 family)